MSKKTEPTPPAHDSSDEWHLLRNVHRREAAFRAVLLSIAIASDRDVLDQGMAEWMRDEARRVLKGEP